MNPQLLEHSLDFMQSEIGYGRKFSQDQRKKIRESICGESDKALEKAVDYILLNFNNLPTPQKLIESVRIEASKNRETAWEKEKRELSQPLQPRTEFAKECMKIAMKFFPLDPPVDYQDIISDAQVMAIKYPNSGWPGIHQEWKSKWDKR